MAKQKRTSKIPLRTVFMGSTSVNHCLWSIAHDYTTMRKPGRLPRLHRRIIFDAGDHPVGDFLEFQFRMKRFTNPECGQFF